jgi:hypothetical protein
MNQRKLTSPQSIVRGGLAEIESIYRVDQVLLFDCAANAQHRLNSMAGVTLLALAERVMVKNGRESELELDIKLHAARRLRCYRPSKQERRLGSHVSQVVWMIQNIERIQGERNHLGLFLRLRKGKIVRKIEVEIDQARTRHRIAGDSRGAIVEYAVEIVVGASRDIDRLAGIKRQGDSQSEEPSGLCRRQQIEFVQPVVV